MTRISAPLLLLLASLSAHGLEWSGSVTRLALPAHLLSDESRQELSPGRRFSVGDRISTGAGGRVALQVNGGARLTLGEESELLVHSVEALRADGGGPLARLALTRGSVRLESPWVDGTFSDVRLNVGALRLRVLGAELWAASESRGDSVCLLTGAVEIMSEIGQDRLDQPGDCLFFNTQFRRILLKPDNAETLARKLTSTAFAGDVTLPARLVDRFAPPATPETSDNEATHSEVVAYAAPVTAPAPVVAEATVVEVPPATTIAPKFGPSYDAAKTPPAFIAEPTDGWTVIVASLENEAMAWKVAQKFANQIEMPVRVLPSGTGRSRVALGRFSSAREAQLAQRDHPLLAQQPNAWVLRETP